MLPPSGDTGRDYSTPKTRSAARGRAIPVSGETRRHRCSPGLQRSAAPDRPGSRASQLRVTLSATPDDALLFPHEVCGAGGLITGLRHCRGKHDCWRRLPSRDSGLGHTQDLPRTVAVDEVSFDVDDGEIFGLIGPNGAGKTTTMECVEGLRTPDRGTISVLGLDPFRDVLRAAGAHRRAAAGGAAAEAHQGLGGRGPLGVALPTAAVDGDRAARAARARRQAQRLVHDAVGRAEAAALHRARAHQRSRRSCSSTS